VERLTAIDLLIKVAGLVKDEILAISKAAYLN
jgi:hypothetical protein